ncbi:MAG: SMC-Scp complex subunit ScpB [Eubacteriales bacterium]|nr:SMC-Scp complex subunit ScpB [Eubacteriales bacterium]
MKDKAMLAKLEALLFASGEGLPLAVLADLLEEEAEVVTSLLIDLADRYQADASSALELRRVEDKYLLSLKQDFQELLSRLYRPGYLSSLSPASYETLACVLYNQPVTRAQVEAVRGVNSDGVMTRLLERGLLEECGVLEQAGRPSLFRVTEKFMLEMGLSSVEELKPLELLMYDNLRQLEEGEELEEEV